MTGGHRGRKALLLCLPYNGRIKVTVRDHWSNGTEQLTESQLTFEAPLLAILFPSHPFRTEGGPYGYKDQALSGGSLLCQVGWTPWESHPNPSLYWDCSWGTIPNAYENPTPYVAGVVAPGQKATPAINAYVDAEQRSRTVEVFGDDLGRDMQNFMGGTNTYPLIWWAHLSNCHGATKHARNGTGTLSGSFECPFSGCAHAEIYHRFADGQEPLDEVTTCPKQRGYIISYVAGANREGSPSHSATLIGNGTATWEVNGGVPPSNLFRQDVIHKDLAAGQELWILLHRPSQ